MFTAQHYIKIAQIISEIEGSEIRSEIRREIAHKFANMLKQDNDNFRIIDFFTACNVDFWGHTPRTPVELAIGSMPYVKGSYARRVWMILSSKYIHTEIPAEWMMLPDEVTESMARDVWVELTQYDTKTGRKI